MRPPQFTPATLITAALLSGCTTAKLVPIDVPFDKAAAAAALKPGSNAVSGSALIRQRGGGVVNCAGGSVYLMPVTAYARHWATAIYGSDAGGFWSTAQQAVQFSNLNNDFAGAVRSATCNASGFFNFPSVADGDFYVFTRITWTVADSLQGGSIMKPVSVRGGQTLEVVLAP